jgi:hypothetical protein
MKIFFLTLALLVAGLAFVAPPLIVFLPALLVGTLLIASPMILSSMVRGMDHGDGARHDQRPTSGTTAR